MKSLHVPSKTPRFRDSHVIRLGMGILAAGVGGLVALATAALRDIDFLVGPIRRLIFLWIVVGSLSIAAGAGQTLIRRRGRKADES